MNLYIFWAFLHGQMRIRIQEAETLGETLQNICVDEKTKTIIT